MDLFWEAHENPLAPSSSINDAKVGSHVHYRLSRSVMMSLDFDFIDFLWGHSEGVDWSNTDDIIIVILRLLLQNECLESLVLHFNDAFENPDHWKVLGELLAISTTLKAVSLEGTTIMDEQAIGYIVEGILRNAGCALECFCLFTNELEHERNLNMIGKNLTRLLRESLTLKELHLHQGCSWFVPSPDVMEGVAEGLAANTTLLRLRVSFLWGDYICKALTPADQCSHLQRGYNKTLKQLSLSGCGGGCKLECPGCYVSFSPVLISNMLQNNHSLEELSLKHCDWDKEHWILVFRSLRSNKTLRKLVLEACEDFGAGDTFDCLTGLLHVNFIIEIELGRRTRDYTELRHGLLRRLQIELELARLLKRNKRISEYMKYFDNLEQSKLGRLYLCGASMAGKTTLRRSMVNSQASSTLLKTVSKHVSGALRPEKRTQGIEIRTLQWRTGECIAIWDMAGQEEYRALHDSHYLFPEINQASLFLFVFRATNVTTGRFDSREAQGRLNKELHYWLTFINSNLARDRVRIPQIFVVLTHSDKVADSFLSAEKYVDWARATVEEMTVTFQGKIEIHQTMYAVDSRSGRDVSKVVNHIRKNFGDVFPKLPKVPDICQKLSLFLANWNLQHQSEPILTSRRFLKLCQQTLHLPELSAILEVLTNCPPGEAAKTIPPEAAEPFPSEAAETMQPRVGETFELEAGDSIQPEAGKTTGAAIPSEAWDNTQPEAGDTAQPEAGDTAQPEAGDTTQPEAGDTTQPDAGDTVQPETGQTTQLQYEETFQPEAAKTASTETADKILKRWHAIVSYLNDVGWIVKFETLDCIVVDVNWLGRKFLGMLFHSEKLRKDLKPSKQGTVEVHELEVFLAKFIKRGNYKGLQVEILIKLLKELKICVGASESRLFMPSMLEDDQGRAHRGTRRLKWTKIQDSSGGIPVHIGFRLLCKDSKRTFLSPGLFLRYQVHLLQKLSEVYPRSSFHYELEWNLIRVYHDGIEMLIESSGETPNLDYADILIRIVDQSDRRKQYAYEKGLLELQHFCESGEGCPGVTLREQILRPECVEKLILCKNRKHQAVSREDLTKMVVEKLQQNMGEPQESWTERIYKQHFEAVQDSEEKLPEAWVEASDLLSSTDFSAIRTGFEQSRIDVSERIVEAVKDLERVISSLTSSRPEASTPSIVRAERSDAERGKSPMILEPSVNDGKRDLCIGLKDVSYQLDSIIKDLHLTRRNQDQNPEQTLREMRNCGNLFLSTFQEEVLMEKIFRASRLEQTLPRLLYLTDFDPKLSERFVSFIKLGSARRMHFMCEEPYQMHFVKDQEGLPVTKELQGKLVKKLRPLVLASAKMMYIFLKAGMHVTAGVGNMIPDIGSTGVVLKASSLTAETLTSEIKTSDQSQSDFKCAWNCLIEEIIAPIRDQIPRIFGLYKVEYKTGALKKPRPTAVHWICRECRDRAQRAGRLQMQNDTKFLGLLKRSEKKS